MVRWPAAHRVSGDCFVFACGLSGFMLRLETNASDTAGANPRGAHPAALKGARGAQDEAGNPLARGHALNSIVHLRMHWGARTTDGCRQTHRECIRPLQYIHSLALRFCVGLSIRSMQYSHDGRLVHTAINNQEMLLDPKLARPGTLPHALLRKNHQIEELQVGRSSSDSARRAGLHVAVHSVLRHGATVLRAARGLACDEP